MLHFVSCRTAVFTPEYQCGVEWTACVANFWPCGDPPLVPHEDPMLMARLCFKVLYTPSLRIVSSHLEVNGGWSSNSCRKGENVSDFPILYGQCGTD